MSYFNEIDQPAYVLGECDRCGMAMIPYGYSPHYCYKCRPKITPITIEEIIDIHEILKTGEFKF